MKRTITELEKELQEIRTRAAKGQYEEGTFGLKECKKAIKWNQEHLHESLYDQYLRLIQRGLTEVCFNTIMIVACEQLMEVEGR